jgi:hypothetical protein
MQTAGEASRAMVERRMVERGIEEMYLARESLSAVAAPAEPA